MSNDKKKIPTLKVKLQLYWLWQTHQEEEIK